MSAKNIDWIGLDLTNLTSSGICWNWIKNCKRKQNSLTSEKRETKAQIVGCFTSRPKRTYTKIKIKIGGHCEEDFCEPSLMRFIHLILKWPLGKIFARGAGQFNNRFFNIYAVGGSNKAWEIVFSSSLSFFCFNSCYLIGSYQD